MPTLNIGEEFLVEIVQPDGPQKWRVRPQNTSPSVDSMTLRTRDSRLYERGDLVSAWLIDQRPTGLILSDSDFGRLPISDRMRPRYIRALTSLEGGLRSDSLDDLKADEISEMKGMFNRCIRRDQWDWLNVYLALGRPPRSTMQMAASTLGALSRAIRSKNHREAEHNLDVLKSQSLLNCVQSGLSQIRRSTPRLPLAPRLSALSPTANGDETSSRTEDDPFIVSQAARVKRERANAAHIETLGVLAAHLSRAGLLVERSVLVDAFCLLPKGPAIFEVKSNTLSNERAQVRHALSQLYEYRYLHDVPNASLWLVLSQRLQNLWLEEYIRKDRGLSLLWVESGRISGPDAEALLDG